MTIARSAHVWMPRYAARLMRLVPKLRGRDVVQYALSAYPDSSDVEPETAAEMHASAFRNTGGFPLFDRHIEQDLPRVSGRKIVKAVPPVRKVTAAFRALFG